jgi:uncharacterized protein (DUF849 family)
VVPLGCQRKGRGAADAQRAMDKLIITAALTGAEVTREQQPALPLSPERSPIAAWECAQAGAAIVHVHARHADGSSTQEAAAYRDIIDAVRARCDVIVQVSTGGAVGMTPPSAWPRWRWRPRWPRCRWVRSTSATTCS